MRQIEITVSMKCVLAAILLTTCAASFAENCMGMPFQSKYLAFLNCIGENSDAFSLHQRSIALSFLGREQEAQLVFGNDRARNAKLDEASPNNPGAFEGMDAISEIARLSMSRKVVMLNEAHHVSQHRAFAHDLATALHKNGYSLLAVEALGDAAKTNKSGYVTASDMSSGYYTHDPEFANFLRQAIAVGYTLVAYETRDGADGYEREQQQAANLATLMASHPQAKVLVYAGYGHIQKNATARYDYMARIFREKTGIDPLTIDQDGGTWNPHAQLTDPVRTRLEPRLGAGLQVFKDVNGTYLTSKSYHGQVDLTVFHPREKLTHGRPDWLANGRKAHLVDISRIGTQRPIALRAMLSNEIDGIPMDQIMLRHSNDEPYLMLPPGEYEIQLETLESGVRSLYKTKIDRTNSP